MLHTPIEMLGSSAETMVVGPNGRVSLRAETRQLLLDAISNDTRLTRTTEEFEIALIVKVPESELPSFCDALGGWLGLMSPEELAMPEMQQLSALYRAHASAGWPAIADVA